MMLIRSGRIVSSLFVALLVLTLLLTLAGLGWYAINPRGRVAGFADSIAGTELLVINEQRQLLAVQLVPNGRITAELSASGIPQGEITLDYRGDTAVSLYSSEQTIHELPPAWLVWSILSLMTIILLLLLFPTRLERIAA